MLLKFLRRLRQNAIAASKVRNYLLYALGEVVLIIVGVLLALSLNNWNQERVARMDERETIRNFNEEFQQNLENLHTAIQRTENAIQSLDVLLTSLNDPAGRQYSGEALDSLLGRISNFYIWRRSDLNIRAMHASGNLNNLRNDSLKTLVYEWMSKIDDLKVIEEKGLYAFQYYIDFIKRNGSWREIDKYLVDGVEGSSLMPDNDHLLKNLEFENCLNSLFIWGTHKKGRYEGFRDLLNSMVKASGK